MQLEREIEQLEKELAEAKAKMTEARQALASTQTFVANVLAEKLEKWTDSAFKGQRNAGMKRAAIRQAIEEVLGGGQSQRINDDVR